MTDVTFAVVVKPQGTPDYTVMYQMKSCTLPHGKRSRKMHNVVSVMAKKEEQEILIHTERRCKKGIKAVWRGDKLRHAVDTCCRTFPAAGQAGGG